MRLCRIGPDVDHAVGDFQVLRLVVAERRGIAHVGALRDPWGGGNFEDFLLQLPRRIPDRVAVDRQVRGGVWRHGRKAALFELAVTATSNASFRLFNIGNNSPVKLGEYVSALEEALGMRAIKELLPLQPGDVPDTFADVSELSSWVGYRPATSVKEGVANFVAWYKDYFHI